MEYVMMNIKKNIGQTDKIIRIIIGLVIIGVGVKFSSWLGVIGIVPIATALMGWCPPYDMLGINTCSTDVTSDKD